MGCVVEWVINGDVSLIFLLYSLIILGMEATFRMVIKNLRFASYGMKLPLVYELCLEGIDR